MHSSPIQSDKVAGWPTLDDLAFSTPATDRGAPSLTQFHRGKGGKPRKPARRVFCFSTPDQNTNSRVDFPNSAQKPDSLSPLRAVSFPHLQLLQETPTPRQREGLFDLRERT